jgi:uncharacterized protein YciI
MEFFAYHRDRPGSAALREALLEDHWSYMDRYADGMIARGPLLADDGETPVGSVHILDVADPVEARAFVFDEPNYQAGVYRDVMLRRWHNTLGRTMWDFPGGYTESSRYFVLGLGSAATTDVAPLIDRDLVIAYGPLLSDNGEARLGTVALVEAPDADTARTVVSADKYADIEVHNWDYGGRPDE